MEYLRAPLIPLIPLIIERDHMTRKRLSHITNEFYCIQPRSHDSVYNKLRACVSGPTTKQELKRIFNAYGFANDKILLKLSQLKEQRLIDYTTEGTYMNELNVQITVEPLPGEVVGEPILHESPVLRDDSSKELAEQFLILEKKVLGKKNLFFRNKDWANLKRLREEFEVPMLRRLITMYWTQHPAKRIENNFNEFYFTRNTLAGYLNEQRAHEADERRIDAKPKIDYGTSKDRLIEQIRMYEGRKGYEKWVVKLKKGLEGIENE